MFPDLDNLLHFVFGVDWQIGLSTYKFFLITAFVTAGIVVYSELRRKEKAGEIPDKSSKEAPVAMLMAVVFGMLGAKVLSALEYLEEFSKDHVVSFFLHNGQSFYGGLILASIAIYFYARYKKVHYTDGLDIAAPAIAIGYASGRLGCHLSGDGCWGIENLTSKPAWLGFLPQWAWACHYPHNSIDRGLLMSNCTADHCHVLANPVFPTSFYEALFSFLVFIFLWFTRKKIKIPGMLFIIFIISSASFRFLIEFIRINPRYNILVISLSQAQIISVFLLISGIAAFWHFKRRSRNSFG